MPRVPDRKGAVGRVVAGVAVRAPHLYRSLRCFCLAGFSLLAGDVEGGAEIPFAFEEHAARGQASLYEYRPLVRSYVDARSERLGALADAGIAVEELRREPAAAIYAAAHSGNGEASLLRTILLPLLADVAEACGGHDWSDEAFDRAYAELERTLLGDRRSYAAVAPLVGLSVGTQVELGEGLRVRVAATGELAAHWPEASGLLPAEFGRAPDRLCLLELERTLAPNVPEPPDAPGELADAVSALRLATAGPVAAGPVLFERLDWRPLAVRPVLPIAAAEPPGEPTRLDAFRARLASDLLERLGRPKRTRSSPRPWTVGSCRSSQTSPSGPSSCARRSPRSSAGSTGCGRRRCAPRSCSASRARSEHVSSTGSERLPAARPRAPLRQRRCARRSWRRWPTATEPS